MNEENGLRGGQFYEKTHRAELARHVAAIESDSGAGRPLGFNLEAGEGAKAIAERIFAPLAAIGAGAILGKGSGADISTLEGAGVPLLGLQQDMTRYFEWHHTDADTLDKVDRQELIQNVVALSFAAWALAESEETLPRSPSKVLARTR
jgi:Zn-dependent M28 family amino/carboxypeptidase